MQMNCKQSRGKSSSVGMSSRRSWWTVGTTPRRQNMMMRMVVVLWIFVCISE